MVKFIFIERRDNLFKKQGKYNEKTDVFGVGIILHQLASGNRHPFDRKKKDGSTIRDNILDGQLNIDERIKLNPTLYEIILGNNLRSISSSFPSLIFFF